MGFLDLFKRPKTEPEERSKGGSPIYRYDDTQAREFQSGEVTPYAEEIDAHMQKCFPDRKTSVFHEIISDLVHVDIYFMKAKNKEDFSILYTSGMSALPMMLPESLLPEYQHLERAELMMMLPSGWDISSYPTNQDIPSELYWPVDLLKFLARFPHEYHTWLAWGHTIPNGGEDYLPYDPSTKLNGCILSALEEKYCILKAKDGTQINFYVVVPLYREEMEYKLDHDAKSLLEKLWKINGAGIILFPDRPNVCAEGSSNKTNFKDSQ